MKTLFKTPRAFFSPARKCALTIGFVTIIASGAAGQNTFPSSGNVGIGTRSPSSPLTVNETGNSINRLVSLANDSSRSSAQTAFSFFEGTTEKFKFGMNSSGATGYVGGVNAFQLWHLQNAPIVFGTNNIERMRINGEGNIGIGTLTPPQFRLDIEGDVNTSTQYKISGATVLRTPGVRNTVVGVSAGLALPDLAPIASESRDNAFFGNAAGRANTAGDGNSFFGSDAGRANTSGRLNSFLGFLAGQQNTTGDGNSFFGNWTGQQNTTGASNSFFGSQAGPRNTTGPHNSFFGSQAGRENTTGRENSFFGAVAGRGNVNGSQNTLVGTTANVGAPGLTNATAIGSFAQVDANNSLVLGGINGVNGATADTNIGIGTTRPAFRLDVAGDVNTSRQYKISGRNVLTLTGNNIFVGEAGDSTTVRIPGRLVLSSVPSTSNTNSILCLNAGNRVSRCSLFSSSLRYKHEVRSFSDGLNLVRQLRPISFRWKADGTADVGLAAEEVAKIAPLLVTRDSTGEVEGVRYDRLGVVLIKAVQEQQAQIKEQELQLQTKDARIANLETRLAALERAMVSPRRPAAQPRRRR